MSDLALLSAVELLDGYRRKTLSPVDATRACLAQIERHNAAQNAFVHVADEASLAQARASEDRWRRDAPAGALDGVPVTIKDLILTRGWPTLRGSKTVDPKGPWNDDAPVVARVREHGAVLLGKTTTPEFGWKGVTDSPLTGITRNPWNKAKTPGGSSGGAAAAVASGMGPLAVGTDGGGSIRIPCSFTGLFGIKGSFGRVPAWPLSPFGTVAHVGPMTRSVADAALMLNVLSLPDARDWHALPYDARDYRTGLDQGVVVWLVQLRIPQAQPPRTLYHGWNRPLLRGARRHFDRGSKPVPATVEVDLLDAHPCRSSAAWLVIMYAKPPFCVHEPVLCCRYSGYRHIAHEPPAELAI